MTIPDHISGSLETIILVKILKFFDADPNPGKFLTLNPGWKKFGSGTNIPDSQDCMQFMSIHDEHTQSLGRGTFSSA